MDPSVRALIQVPILLQTLLPKRVTQSLNSSSFPLSLDAQHTITSCNGNSTIRAPQHMAHTHQCSDNHHHYDGHINPKIIMASEDVLCLLPPRSLAPNSMPSISSAKWRVPKTINLLARTSSSFFWQYHKNSFVKRGELVNMWHLLQ